MNVVVLTSDAHNWCLKPFSLLFNKYWSDNQHVDIGGYTPPEFDLPSNFQFHSIATPQYNKARWSEGVLRFFKMTGFSHAVLLLEDYWLTRRVDPKDVDILLDFMHYFNDEALRVDLTADRLYAGGCKDTGYWDKFDIVQAKDSQYEMSLQAGLWNVKKLMEVLAQLPEGHRSAWDAELKGTEIVNNNDMNVFGTRQWPVRYANGLNNAIGKKAILTGLTNQDIDMIMPFIPEENRP